MDVRNGQSSKELRSRLRIENISEVMRRDGLRWFGHVERKDGDDCVKHVKLF